MQERCAMKVCTDACLLGGYSARYLRGSKGVERVLDIGTGTGLLSLMGAQQSGASFVGVEMDAVACLQAKENFAASPWKERLEAVCGDVRSFVAPAPFDFIVTNPPFYEDDLKSGDALRNQAMHATRLRFPELLGVIKLQLRAGGAFAVLLPNISFATFQALAMAEGYHLQRALHIRNRMGAPLFRSIGIFTDRAVEAAVEEMEIYGEARQYTPAFTDLLKDYYLYL